MEQTSHKVSRSFREYYDLLNKRIKYLQDILFNFRSQRLVIINKNRENLQYEGGDLVTLFQLNKSVKNLLPEDSSKICRPCSNLENSRPSQLFIGDIRWNNIEGNF